MFLSKLFSLGTGIGVYPPTIPDEGYDGLFGQVYEDIFGGFGDFLLGIEEGVTSIADFVVSAFEGAGEILGYIADLFPSLNILADLIGGNTFGIVEVILSVMATIITFKVVGYFT